MEGLQVITREILNGKVYVSTVSRGTEYCLCRNADAWIVRTRRLGLGRHNLGGCKHFATLADVAAGCKVFGTVENLTELVFGVSI